MPLKTETKVEFTPDQFLVSPCDPVKAGTTVQSLSEGFVINTQCLILHKELLEKQKEHKRKVMEVYGNK
jgi:hypothetical protein